MNGQDSCEDVGKEKELFIVIVCYEGHFTSISIISDKSRISCQGTYYLHTSLYYDVSFK